MTGLGSEHFWVRCGQDHGVFDNLRASKCVGVDPEHRGMQAHTLGCPNPLSHFFSILLPLFQGFIILLPSHPHFLENGLPTS